jgi:UDP-N-acetylmuramoyl-L-alanyl-D-glutamate--2,6-diaminopimelate ligase
MKSIRTNSKFVTRGDIFVGISCSDLNVHVEEAIKNGACLVFAENCEDTRVISVSDARLLVSRLAKFAYDEQPECCVALTGTNGKSSTSHFLRQIWTRSGQVAATLGTYGLFINEEIVIPPEIHVSTLTTPDPITLHKIMCYLRQNDVTHFVFEASSPALDQKRLHSAILNAAAFTNLARDHLDYHGTEKAYFKAKMLLFEEILPRDRPAVVSFDYPVIYDAVSKLNDNIVTFGFEIGNFVRAENLKEGQGGTMFDFVCGHERFDDVHVNLIGKFQVMNLLCASAIAFACGLDVATIHSALSDINTASGVMEYVKSINGGDIYVDFAHTACGFRMALQCFRSICAGRLICVFGCGGNRDNEKRAEMGRIADELADIVVITDDNPRYEDPAKIRAALLAQCPRAVEIGDRREAIHYAANIIERGDVVAIIGKGHENYQIYGDKTTLFNDKEEALTVSV